MSRYDGLIIPRSYSEYINKTDAATLQQALQLSGVLSEIVAAGDNKAVTSNAVNSALDEVPKKTKTIPYPYDVFGSRVKSQWNAVPNGTQFVEMEIGGPVCSSIFFKLNENHGFVIGFGYYPSLFGLIFMQLHDGNWSDPVLLDMSM